MVGTAGLVNGVSQVNVDSNRRYVLAVKQRLNTTLDAVLQCIEAASTATDSVSPAQLLSVTRCSLQTSSPAPTPIFCHWNKGAVLFIIVSASAASSYIA